MKKVTDLSKRYWKYILVAIIALYIGSTTGGTSTTEYNSVLDKNKELLAQSDKLSKENKELQAKVDEAKPYFALAEQERQAKIEEGKRKEAEAKAQKKLKKKLKLRKKHEQMLKLKRVAEEKLRKVMILELLTTN